MVSLFFVLQMAELDKEKWQAARSILRKLRGNNAYRGGVKEIANKGEIWLEIEARGTLKQPGALIIHIGDSEATTCFRTATQHRCQSEYHSLEEFMAAAVALARSGKPYIRTYDDKVTYK